MSPPPTTPPAPPTVVHLVVGPDRHGVVRHALQVAQACGHPVVRVERPDQVQPADLLGFDIVHLPYSDRLFADRCEDSATVVEQLVAPPLEHGVALSFTLHDLPAGDSALETRRRAAYSRVVRGARGIVVASSRELGLLAQLSDQARSVRRIPLPVPVHPTTRPVQSDGAVVVLGFLFPDRGYEHTIAELPPGTDLLALGGPSAGHDDLPEVLAQRAADAGHQLRVTGFVPDEELPARLVTAGIPVAPNRRVASSASIATWLGHGRRPLVPDTPYTRELLEQWPGTLTLYDPDRPGDLRQAIEQAVADPDLTWLRADTPAGPTLAEAGADYDRHFAACAPDTRISVGPGRWVVPGNRWDLVANLEPAPAPVSVVIPYFEAQPQLDLVLAALSIQTHPAARLQIVVADDGSAHPPDLTAANGLDVQVVRQQDRGFRAAAARNLGAAAADGEVLLFLDGDTVPEPDYVRRLSRLPSLVPDALTVGRRRHADLTGWTPDRVTSWLGGGGGTPTELSEPSWLVDGYRDSHDLLEIDSRSYRYVISAVFGLQRDLFVELGGFNEDFTSYGGEDWELAHRAVVAGAVLAHVPGAVAWHDGPDWAGRSPGQPGDKNAEILALTRLLPDPQARGGGQWLPCPAVVVLVPAGDLAAVLATARSAFAGDTDCGLWLTGPNAESVANSLGDPRIQAGPVPRKVLERASVLVELDSPTRLAELGELATAATTAGQLSAPAGTIIASRVRNRSARWAKAVGLSEDQLAVRLFGRRDLPAPTRAPAVDLAHELTRIYRSVRRS